MKKKWIIIIGVILVLIIWFITSPCGRKEGYGNFNVYKCKCAGIVAGDIFEISSLDSTLDYRCYGIKIGKTKLTDTNMDFRLKELDMQIERITPDFASKRLVNFDLGIHNKICFVEPNIVYFDDNKEESHNINEFKLQNSELCIEGENHIAKIMFEGRGDHALISTS